MRSVFGGSPPETDAERNERRSTFDRMRDAFGTLDGEIQVEFVVDELWSLSAGASPFVVEQIAHAAESLAHVARRTELHTVVALTRPESSAVRAERARIVFSEVRPWLSKLDNDERGHFLVRALEQLSGHVDERTVAPIERQRERLVREVLQPHRARLASAWHDDDLWSE